MIVRPRGADKLCRWTDERGVAIAAVDLKRTLDLQRAKRLSHNVVRESEPNQLSRRFDVRLRREVTV
jgi:hypothetical protein